MKNRYVGLVTVLFPDGYVEQCLIIEKTSKGEQCFLSQMKEAIKEILKFVPKGRVTVRYKGDFSKAIYEALKKEERLRTENPPT